MLFMNPANLFPQAEDVYQPFPELPNFLVLHESVDYKPYVKGKLVLWCAVNQLPFLQKHPHDLSVFDSCDLASDEFSAWKELVPLMEKHTQLTFASSSAIYAEHTKRGIDTVLLPNGADYEHFEVALNRMQRPADLPDTQGKPLVGYYGAIYTWMDLELVYSIADHYPTVLIGSNCLYNREVSHPNVTMLDMKPYALLPSYLSWFDVAIIPFKLSPMIAGCDPVKFYEYMSAGKPVVASEMAELRRFDSYVYFAHKDNAPAIVAQALAEHNDLQAKRRHALASKHSWRNRGTCALAHIVRKLEERDKGERTS